MVYRFTNGIPKNCSTRPTVARDPRELAHSRATHGRPTDDPWEARTHGSTGGTGISTLRFVQCCKILTHRYIRQLLKIKIY